MTASAVLRSVPAALPRERLASARRVADAVSLAALLALPGALTAWLAFHAGGFFAGDTGAAAVLVLAVLALRALAGRVVLPGVGFALAAVALPLGAYAAWVAASGSWSHAPARALIDYDRALLYAGLLVLFGSVGWTPGRLRWVLRGLAVAVTATCVLAAIAVLLPDVIHTHLQRSDRPSWPITYWNSLGLLGGFGVLLGAHLSSDPSELRAVRVLGAAAVPLCALVTVLTLSRGAFAATLAGGVAYVVAARPRLAVCTVLATVPAAVLAAKGVWGDHLDHGSVRSAWTLLAAVGAGAFLRAVLLPLDGRLLDWRLRPGLGRRLSIAAAVIALLVAGGAAMAAGVPGKIADAAHQVDTDPEIGGGSGRLLSASGNGRGALWRAALDEHKTAPLKGTGAGTFGFAWAHRHAGYGVAYDAHSLYLESLGELGWIGFALIVSFLVAALVVLIRRARGPDRGLAGAAIGLFVAWALAAAVDWQWEVPAVTAWLFVLVGCAAGSTRERRPSRPVRSVPFRLGVAALALALVGTPLAMARSQAHLDRAVKAFDRGDCVTADQQALAGVRALASRPQPWEFIAYCAARRGDERTAGGAITQAMRRDPQDARLHVNAALIDASFGRDPRPQLRQAKALDPHATVVDDLFDALKDTPRAKWRRIGRLSDLVLQ